MMNAIRDTKNIFRQQCHFSYKFALYTLEIRNLADLPEDKFHVKN